jgi:hypothetical protein
MTVKLGEKEAAGKSLKRAKAAVLNPSVAKRLLAYASVAGAGVACISKAQAEVVYTSTHHTVHLSYALDLNNDGIIDFHIESYELSGFSSLSVKPAVKGNQIGAAHKDECYMSSAAVLPAGAVIGADKSFSPDATCMFAGYRFGPWAYEKNRYLGLEFLINGETHFGWARLSINRYYCFGCVARIEGYAYETVAGKSITAGDEGNSAESTITPGSLGVLALGAAGTK